MNEKVLYSIGHSNRKAEDFLPLLKKFNIQYLIDVRSVPYSKYNTQYKQAVLKSFLENNNITYVFMGDNLGGKPKDASCYKNGKINYARVQEKDFFIQGIERLKKAYDKNIPAAIMCSEANPCHCHRSRLIGKALQEQNIFVQHIDENGNIKDQLEVMKEIRKNVLPDLFDHDLLSSV